MFVFIIREKVGIKKVLPEERIMYLELLVQTNLNTSQSSFSEVTSGVLILRPFSLRYGEF